MRNTILTMLGNEKQYPNHEDFFILTILGNEKHYPNHVG